MQLSSRAKLSAYVVVIVYSLLLSAFNSIPQAAITRIATALPMGIAVIFWIYDNHLWFRKWLLRFAGRPYVAGTWRGTLISYRRDEGGGPITSTHDVILVIRQTFLAITVTLMSEQSKSRSAVAVIRKEMPDDYKLHYQYQNEPRMEHRDRGSQIHFGGAAIQIGGSTPTKLEGEYWTSRDTRGTLSLTLIDRKPVASFEDGMTLEGAL